MTRLNQGSERALTNPTEVERLLRAQALILAESDGMLVGSVNVNLMNDGVGACMLVLENTVA